MCVCVCVCVCLCVSVCNMVGIFAFSGYIFTGHLTDFSVGKFFFVSTKKYIFVILCIQI